MTRLDTKNLIALGRHGAIYSLSTSNIHTYEFLRLKDSSQWVSD